MPQAADRAARPLPPAQEALCTTPRVSYRSQLFISIMSLGQNVKQNSYLLSLGYHPASETPSFQFLRFGDYCRTLPETSIGSIWTCFGQVLQLNRADWPGVSPACSKSYLVWWENFLFGKEHTFFCRFDSCGFQASELSFDCRSEEEIFISTYLCLSTRVSWCPSDPHASPGDIKPDFVWAGLIAEPKAVPACLKNLLWQTFDRFGRKNRVWITCPDQLPVFSILDVF